ncbi:MAG: hypothetical protein HY619_01685 [Thaumarchaeota archaeon]|nr:hypothetical protein [Nitrososphaerota archaeon]
MCLEIEACPVCGMYIYYEEFGKHLETHRKPEEILEPKTEPLTVTVPVKKKVPR